MYGQNLKLSVALKSKSTLTECILLVLVVLISIGRTMDVPWASRALAESCLGSLFFHLGLQGRAFLFRVEGRSASIGSQISVLTSSMFNTANLFTNSDRGALFAGHAKQNSPPGQNQLPLPPLYSSEPSSLQLIPPFALQLTSGHPNDGGNPLQDG